MGGISRTIVPRPRATRTSPSLRSIATALLTVLLLTPYRLASSGSGGRAEPAGYSPLSMAARSSAASCRYWDCCFSIATSCFCSLLLGPSRGRYPTLDVSRPVFGKASPSPHHRMMTRRLTSDVYSVPDSKAPCWQTGGDADGGLRQAPRYADNRGR